MAESKTKSKSIYEKLSDLRHEFAEIGISKKGLNPQLRSDFFTLDDIVNTSRKLFKKHRILPMDSFTHTEAKLTLIDLDNAESRIDFTIPMREYMGNAAVTPVQAMGATVTYYRRYLYSIALDLAERDELEEGFNTAPLPTAAPKKSTAPPTAEERKAIKEELTAPDEPATALQVKGLKASLKKLKDADTTQEEWIAQIAVETEAFTNLSKMKCESLIKEVSTMLKEKEGK